MAFRLLGLALLLLPFLSLGPYLETNEIPSVALALRSTALVVLLSALSLIIAPNFRFSSTLEIVFSSSRRAFVVVCLAVLAFLLLLVVFVGNQAKPLLVDEVVQLFQAKIFAAGRITAPLPRYPQFFMVQNVVFDEQRWYGQYPPLHSALLAIGILLRAPWAVPVVLTVLSALLLFDFSQRVYDEQTARLTLLLLLLSPFFLFLGASYMNHVSALFCFALALWSFARWESDCGRRYLLIAAAALALCSLSRPLCALAALIVFLPLVFTVRGKRVELLWAGVVLALGPAVFMAYNALTTGDSLLPGYVKLWGENHGLGFHLSPYGEPHTVLDGLQKQLLNIALLNRDLFAFPIPALIPLGLFFVFAPSERWDRWLLWMFAALVGVYVFYWHRDSYLGPRYLYLAVASLVPLTARALVVLHERWSTVSLRLFKKELSLSRFGERVFVISLIAAVGFILPQQIGLRANALMMMKRDVLQDAARAGITRGLIFIPVSFGERLLSQLRARGLDASFVEQAYRRTDHCVLFGLLKEFETRGVDELRAAILAAQGHELYYPQIGVDRTLRLRRDIALDERCRAEIVSDRGWRTSYLPYLLANNPDLTGPYIVAMDHNEENRLLSEVYPELAAYRYRDGEVEPL